MFDNATQMFPSVPSHVLLGWDDPADRVRARHEYYRFDNAVQALTLIPRPVSLDWYDPAAQARVRREYYNVHRYGNEDLVSIQATTLGIVTGSSMQLTFDIYNEAILYIPFGTVFQTLSDEMNEEELLETEWWQAMHTKHKLMFAVSISLFIIGAVDLILNLLGGTSLFYWTSDILLLLGGFGLLGTSTLAAVDAVKD